MAPFLPGNPSGNVAFFNQLVHSEQIENLLLTNAPEIDLFEIKTSKGLRPAEEGCPELGKLKILSTYTSVVVAKLRQV